MTWKNCSVCFESFNGGGYRGGTCSQECARTWVTFQVLSGIKYELAYMITVLDHTGSHIPPEQWMSIKNVKDSSESD